MPDINNDSMVGDLNQLINDLNSGNPAAQLSARLRCQQLNVASNVSTRKSVPLISYDDQNNVYEQLKQNQKAHNTIEAKTSGATVKKSDNSFDNLQAKAMYFDPASSQAAASAEPKTVDYLASNNFASDGDYMASSASAGNRKTTGPISGRSDNKSDSGQKKSQSKLKYIEQSAKA